MQLCVKLKSILSLLSYSIQEKFGINLVLKRVLNETLGTNPRRGTRKGSLTSQTAATGRGEGCF